MRWVIPLEQSWVKKSGLITGPSYNTGSRCHRLSAELSQHRRKVAVNAENSSDTPRNPILIRLEFE